MLPSRRRSPALAWPIPRVSRPPVYRREQHLFKHCYYSSREHRTCRQDRYADAGAGIRPGLRRAARAQSAPERPVAGMYISSFGGWSTGASTLVITWSKSSPASCAALSKPTPSTITLPSSSMVSSPALSKRSAPVSPSPMAGRRRSFVGCRCRPRPRYAASTRCRAQARRPWR